MSNNSLASTSKALEQSLLATLTTYASEGKIVLAPNYSVENALKSAFLKMSELKDKNGNLALQTCSSASISQAILDMAIQGLNPSKGQCYFIPTAGKMTLFRSYLGTVSVLMLMRPDIVSIKADVIHQGDTYRIVHTENGDLSIADHTTPSLETLDAPIIGAYAKIMGKDGTLLASCVMTQKEIEASWDQSTNKGWRTNASDVHRKFPQEMAKKSVLGRACKLLIGASNDSSLIGEAFQRTSENEWKAGNMRNVTPADAGKGASALKARLTQKAVPSPEPPAESVIGQEPEQEPVPATEQQDEAPEQYFDADTGEVF